MQAFDFDYCDTDDLYGSGVVLRNNEVRMFKCDECKVNKTIVKKSVNDSRFRCENCIQNQNQNQNEIQAQVPYFPNSLVLEMPQTTSTTTSTTSTTSTTTTPPQFLWRWLQFFT